MNELLERLSDRFPVPTVATSSSVSLTGATISIVERLQIFVSIAAGTIGLIAGIFAIAVSIRTLKLRKMQIDGERGDGGR